MRKWKWEQRPAILLPGHQEKQETVMKRAAKGKSSKQ